MEMKCTCPTDLADQDRHEPHCPVGQLDAAGNQRLSYLHVEVLSRDKGAWVRQARQERMNLTQWVIKTLCGAVHSPVSDEKNRAARV